MIHRLVAGLALAFVVALAGVLGADRGAGNIPFSESRLVRANGGVAFVSWPYNDHRFAHGVGRHELPRGFRDDLMTEGLSSPTALRFLPDGSLLVAEQRGTVVHYRLGDPRPDRVVIDARADVFNQNQMGLLGLGIDPDFPDEPYVYILYSRDAVDGGESPEYGIGTDDDPCPDDGLCPASGRLVRYRVDPTSYVADGPAEVLVDGWCTHDVNHGVGNIAFDPKNGALLAGGGDGASGSDPDWGQLGSPLNGCGDPPAPAGSVLTPPTTEGGSLRSQDLALGTDPVGLSGSIIRVDRRTGDGLPDNPLAGAADANARRIFAYGLRNPFRFTFRPGSDEVWVADVGWNDYEELDILPGTAGDEPRNYGWPCYEGPYRQRMWATFGTDACDSLYAAESSVSFPTISFPHDARTNQRGCNSRGAALATMTFYDGDMFPAAFDGALFVTDLPRACLFVIQTGADGAPDVRTTRMFARRFRAVDMVVGPDGAMYYVDVYSGSLHRISYPG